MRFRVALLAACGGGNTAIPRQLALPQPTISNGGAAFGSGTVTCSVFLNR
jgi:hypothetical protein